ncbi:MAG: NAD-dependent epimerase/dehydratase family protein [Rhizomicrobium sp.]
MAVHLITGGAGFIGVNLARRLLAADDKVIAVDDLSRGRLEFLKSFANNPRMSFAKLDCSDALGFRDGIAEIHKRDAITDVWHMAANSDIPAGVADPRIDLERTFMTTFATLLVMRDLNIPAIHFASSSAVYGDLNDLAIAENSGPIEPISNYGAMKLASEAQIRAAVESYVQRANIFRFPNVVGVPATHGVIVDLVRKAHATPEGFDVLGDGTQQKIYLHVEDLVDAMLYIRRHARGRYNVFNIGPKDDGITVREIAEAVRDKAAPKAEIRFGSGNKGWVGDVPRFRYETAKLSALGWSATMGSHGAVMKAVEQIQVQEAGA